ncbi:hypothetical protein JB92DRAFT_3096226 [Gautieria morchelliformis]|nr:hypothetical protein JB92DRAFT_3096226 [Gautieria morchelliformis]
MDLARCLPSDDDFKLQVHNIVFPEPRGGGWTWLPNITPASWVWIALQGPPGRHNGSTMSDICQTRSRGATMRLLLCALGLGHHQTWCLRMTETKTMMMRLVPRRPAGPKPPKPSPKTKGNRGEDYQKGPCNCRVAFAHGDRKGKICKRLFESGRHLDLKRHKATHAVQEWKWLEDGVISRTGGGPWHLKVFDGKERGLISVVLLRSYFVTRFLTRQFIGSFLVLTLRKTDRRRLLVPSRLVAKGEGFVRASKRATLWSKWPPNFFTTIRGNKEKGARCDGGTQQDGKVIAKHPSSNGVEKTFSFIIVIQITQRSANHQFMKRINE